MNCKFLLIGVLVFCMGCASIAESLFDSAIDGIHETEEEKQIKEDLKRVEEERPLLYHRTEKSLHLHRYSLEDKERDREQYREELKKRKNKEKKSQYLMNDIVM